MTNEDIKILIVDDDEVNRQCGEINLTRFTKYPNVASADDGTTGLKYLQDNPDVDIVFLDRMMIHMNGIPMLQKMNENSNYRNIIPVFQTGEVGIDEKKECIDNGSLYVLQKPYDHNQQGIITEFVASYIRAKRRMMDLLKSSTAKEKKFELNNFKEAETVAAKLALHYPDPLMVYESIYGLLINAIEHGNLGLGYKNKINYANYNEYIEFINSNIKKTKKKVTAKLEIDGETLKLTISDQGKGFDFSDFPEFNANVIDKHSGRGIYKAQNTFDSVEYINGGKKVVCIVG